ncbi:MAG: TIGR01777 family oxidoreductase [Isosphaeraceae bacterium]
MRVFLTGGTGLVGRHLVRDLIRRGDRPVVLTRSEAKARSEPSLNGAEFVQGDPGKPGDWQRSIDGCDGVINLVGHGVFDDRWTPEVRKKIRDSRVDSTANVVQAIRDAGQKPGVLVSASAIGYYGPSDDRELDESSPPGDGFLPDICKDWEAAARAAEGLGTRVAIVRVGIVLDPSSGALKTMLPIFRYLPGGAAPVGGASNPFLPANGSQWMSWIHIQDIVGIFLAALDKSEATGPFNGTAPEPARNAEFSRELARAVRKGIWPPFLPFGPPDFLLRAVLGEMSEVVTQGQRVIPRRTIELGYAFRFPTLRGALADLFGVGRGDSNC